MASRADMLKKMKMPEKPMGAEEADMDLEALGEEEEGAEMEAEGEEMDLDEELESPLADIEDELLLKEIQKRGLSVPSPEEGEEEDEDMEELDEEDSEAVPPQPILGGY